MTPAEAQVAEEGDDVDFTVADVNADDVIIALAECDNVTTTDGTVSFEATDDDEADFGTVDAVITSVNDIVLTSPSSQVAAQPEDGTITFTVSGDATAQECVTAVVFDNDEGDDALDLNADGEPTEGFGIGGDVTFETVSSLELTPLTATNPFGENHTVTAQLTTDEDVDGDGDLDPARYAGERIVFQISRDGTVVSTQAAETDANGAAELTYTLADPTGNDDPDVTDTITAFWDEDGDSVEDAGEIDETAAASKTWSEDAAAITTLDVAPEFDTNLVETVHTVTAEVTDQYGNPIAGEDVRFEVYRENDDPSTPGAVEYDAVAGASVVRATAADGVATFRYTGPDASNDDVIVVCADDPTTTGTDETTDCGAATPVAAPQAGAFTLEADPDGADFNDQVEKAWVEEAADAEVTTASEDIIGFDTTANTVTVADSAQGNLQYEYDADDQFFVGAAGTTAATMAQFEANLDLTDTLEVEAYDVDGVSVFRLTDV